MQQNGFELGQSAQVIHLAAGWDRGPRAGSWLASQVAKLGSGAASRPPAVAWSMVVGKAGTAAWSDARHKGIALRQERRNRAAIRVFFGTVFSFLVHRPPLVWCGEPFEDAWTSSPTPCASSATPTACAR